MIIVDLSQIIIAVAFQNLKEEPDKDVITSMVFKTLLSYKKRFGNKYGKIILAIDKIGIKSWRKIKYPFYKVRRKNKLQDEKTRATWEFIFECSSEIVSVCEEKMTWQTIGFDGAEADDVIAVLCELHGDVEPCLIISTDGDFLQLQKFKYVKQYSTLKKEFLTTDDPMQSVHVKILKGDVGDDIPNILSDNQCFITKKRQTSVTSAIINEWKIDPGNIIDKYKKRYIENRELIDFQYIPNEIREGILDVYSKTNGNPVSVLMEYFMKQKFIELLKEIDAFRVKVGEYEQPNKLCTNEDFFD